VVDGALVSLAEQDRSAWDREAIAEGVAVVERALRLPRPGSYAIQAAIAAVHAEAVTFADTDWAQIAGLYEQLLRHDPSPVVALNRAVAVGFAEGAEAGLALLPDDPRLSRYAPLHAARFELLRRTGDDAAAAAALDTAISLTANEAERDALRNLKGLSL
jgi:RNA polymerase sigma-70 factor (ECF subfamily)